MKKYTVKQLSALAGVSIRTLHYYDEIGLLEPNERTASGYRYYGQEELYRLQQVLFYRELDYPLSEIRSILDDPDFDLIRSLRFHKAEMSKRADRMQALLDTVEKTLTALKEKEGMITEEEMYAGFPKEEVPKIKEEVVNRWGKDKLNAVEDNIRQMSKQEWGNLQQEEGEINLWLANLMHKAPADVEVQKVVKLHHQYLNQFYAIGIPAYRGLGEMYVQDERFKAHYDKVKAGLAEFLNQAIQVYCENGMEVKA